MSKEVLLGSIADLKTGPFGTQLHADEYVSEGVPVINVRNIGYGNILADDIDMVSEETVSRLSEHKLCENDIVFGRKGSIDRHAFIEKRYDGWMQGSDCIRVRIQDPEVNPRYVSHYLKLDSVKKQLINGAVGSTMPSMNTDVLKSISVLLPDKSVQDVVEGILSSIEEKIENNNAICSNLEAMAKLLYDYWFVQFDFPDENGNPYKSSGGKMVWNDELKREIPAGWEVKPLSEVFDITMGSSPSGESLNTDGNGVEFYQGSTDFGDLYPSIRVFTTSPVRFAKAQDVLMSVRAPVGDMNIAMNDCCIGRGLASLRSKVGCQSYLFYQLQELEHVFSVSDDDGTVFGSINKDDLHCIEVVIPTLQEMTVFEEHASVVDKQIGLKGKVINNLTELQSLLLARMGK